LRFSGSSFACESAAAPVRLNGSAARAGSSLVTPRLHTEDGARYPLEFPAWAEATTLQADPEALLAIQSRELLADGVPTLDDFPVPILLIAGELEDETHEAAGIAGMVPRGESLRLPGLGHGGACAASSIAVPAARDFLERWFV